LTRSARQGKTASLSIGRSSSLASGLRPGRLRAHSIRCAPPRARSAPGLRSTAHVPRRPAAGALRLLASSDRFEGGAPAARHGTCAGVGVARAHSGLAEVLMRSSFGCSRIHQALVVERARVMRSTLTPSEEALWAFASPEAARRLVSAAGPHWALHRRFCRCRASAHRRGRWWVSRQTSCRRCAPRSGAGSARLSGAAARGCARARAAAGGDRSRENGARLNVIELRFKQRPPRHASVWTASRRCSLAPPRERAVRRRLRPNGRAMTRAARPMAIGARRPARSATSPVLG
jgi:hypothetical protein